MTACTMDKCVEKAMTKIKAAQGLRYIRALRDVTASPDVALSEFVARFTTCRDRKDEVAMVLMERPDVRNILRCAGFQL